MFAKFGITDENELRIKFIEAGNRLNKSKPDEIVADALCATCCSQRNKIWKPKRARHAATMPPNQIAERMESMVLFGRESHGSLAPEKRPGMTIVAGRRFPSHLAFRIGFGSRRRLFSPFLGISVFLGVFFLSLARDRISSGTTDRLIQRAIDSLRFLRPEEARSSESQLQHS